MSFVFSEGDSTCFFDTKKLFCIVKTTKDAPLLVLDELQFNLFVIIINMCICRRGTFFDSERAG